MLRKLVDGGRSAVFLGGVVRLAASKKLKERALYDDDAGIGAFAFFFVGHFPFAFSWLSADADADSRIAFSRSAGVDSRVRLDSLTGPFLFWRKARPINPSATRMAPAIIIQCGYSQSNSKCSIWPLPPHSFFPFAFRAARACASLCSNSARLSSSGRSKKLSLTYNPRFSSGSSLSMLQSLNTHLVNANCSVPWSISSVHFTNSQRSKRVKVILLRKSN